MTEQSKQDNENNLAPKESSITSDMIRDRTRVVFQGPKPISRGELDRGPIHIKTTSKKNEDGTITLDSTAFVHEIPVASIDQTFKNDSIRTHSVLRGQEEFGFYTNLELIEEDPPKQGLPKKFVTNGKTGISKPIEELDKARIESIIKTFRLKSKA
jgi:hypothetical protein